MYDYKVVDGHLTDVQYDGNGYFDCPHRHLTSLKCCPEVINGVFNCNGNYLTTLEGCPKVVNGDFYCDDNSLKTLKGCPEVVTGEFHCSFNSKLEDISDLPESVEELNICDCPNIKVFPRHIKGTLLIWLLPKSVLKRLKKQKHLEILEIVEEGYNFVTIREKSLGNQLLEAL